MSRRWVPHINMSFENSARKLVPDLSVILVTKDSFAPLRRMVRRSLAAQTVRDRLEIVIVCPSKALLGLVEGEIAGFHSVRVIEVGEVKTTSAARVSGI